ncbi:MAG: nucleotidyltransferase family protein [Legionellaceae bacterium]|nr:nucleotidyltransferase family protein [Legionellaceae bacterium]
MNSAMLLAAGRGERLKPLTDRCPKALCQVGHFPLIVHHIQHLTQAGITHLVINHAWLGGHIRRYLGNGNAFGVCIEYSAEPPGGLETGGGIYQALPLLGSAPFICVNADIYSDYDFSRLFDIPSTTAAHVVLVHNPKHHPGGDFGLSDAGYVLNHSRHYTFSGIARYAPSLFRQQSTGRYSIAPLLREQAEHQQVTASLHEGLWLDIGCADRLQQAHHHALTTG